MRIFVRVRQKELQVEVGHGVQLLKWLAFVATNKYCSTSLGCPSETAPAYIRVEEGKVLDPFVRICDAVSADAVLRVVLANDTAEVKGLECSVLGLEEPQTLFSSVSRLHCLSVYPAGDLAMFSDALCRIISDPESSQYIGWSRSGHSLIIEDNQKFVHGLMVKYLPYADLDVFVRNITLCNFIQSYPPHNEDGDPRYRNETRMEFVHSFGTFTRSSVSHSEALCKTATGGAGSKESNLVEIGRRADRLLTGIHLAVSQHPGEWVRTTLSPSSMVPEDVIYEETLLLHQSVLDRLPFLLGYFRKCCYGSGESLTVLRMADFGEAMQSLDGLVDDQCTAEDVETAFVEACDIHRAQDDSDVVDDSMRRMDFGEFVAAVLRLSRKKYCKTISSLCGCFQRFLERSFLPVARGYADGDYLLLGTFSQFLDREDVENALIEYSHKISDLYYLMVAHGEKSLSYDRWRHFLGMLRMLGPNAEANALLIRRAFALSSSLVDDGGFSPVLTLKHFRYTLMLFFLLHNDLAGSGEISPQQCLRLREFLDLFIREISFHARPRQKKKQFARR